MKVAGTTPGRAKIVDDGAPEVSIRTDGPCLRGTFDNLLVAKDDKPIKPDELEKTKGQAVDLLDMVLRAYASNVAVGEVGANGTGVAGNTPPLAKECPTGLLYGRIQSGKTRAMLAFTALALDNGFRVVVVLTSDNVKLVEQTASRFDQLAGPRLRNSTTMEVWSQDVAHDADQIVDSGLVLICAKNQSHLAKLVAYLRDVGAANYPALVLDDEADQATLDTTTNARASGKARAPKQGSTISRRTTKNDAPSEFGDSVREMLRHHVFLQVTATPYALLLQNIDSPLRPQFTKLLEPGDGYTGGEHFFSADHIDEEAAPLIFVPDDESAALERGCDVAPPGLQAALSFFMVSASAQLLLDPESRNEPQNFLCHTSQKTTEHDKLYDLIWDFAEKILVAIKKLPLRGEEAIHLEKAHAELRKTLPEAPPLESIVSSLRPRLANRDIILVNSTGSNADFSRKLNFIIGGNILGRGLTIKNLLVTYYLRRAKVSQMDTMLQHARMFGYRKKLMPYTRVFVPELLATRFHSIHVAEANLRELLSKQNRDVKVPIQVIGGLRATRNGVLDMTSIQVYTPGQQIYPFRPAFGPKPFEQHKKVGEKILALLGGSLEPRREDNLVETSIDQVLELLDKIPVEISEQSSWDLAGLRGALSSVKERFRNEAFLFYRRLTPQKKKFSTGALSGDEHKALKLKRRPVLCLFKEAETKNHFDHPFWYPTIVLPLEEDMPAHVFNATELT